MKTKFDDCSLASAWFTQHREFCLIPRPPETQNFIQSVRKRESRRMTGGHTTKMLIWPKTYCTVLDYLLISSSRSKGLISQSGRASWSLTWVTRSLGHSTVQCTPPSAVQVQSSPVVPPIGSSSIVATAAHCLSPPGHFPTCPSRAVYSPATTMTSSSCCA
ncbi:hypothetical protein BD289DRAFT_140795 [Coniella lustricola]|uniref:Uncharacterized protein n=1 Tax=Coniella lustricola TaxID=2025994 RepID=A0A2T3AF71_9PEZI|nr:hypothetical protein BD289DRAFT_140795 [Coniella lustricola]